MKEIFCCILVFIQIRILKISFKKRRKRTENSRFGFSISLRLWHVILRNLHLSVDMSDISIVLRSNRRRLEALEVHFIGVTYMHLYENPRERYQSLRVSKAFCRGEITEGRAPNFLWSPSRTKLDYWHIDSTWYHFRPNLGDLCTTAEESSRNFTKNILPAKSLRKIKVSIRHKVVSV